MCFAFLTAFYGSEYPICKLYLKTHFFCFPNTGLFLQFVCFCLHNQFSFGYSFRFFHSLLPVFSHPKSVLQKAIPNKSLSPSDCVSIYWPRYCPSFVSSPTFFFFFFYPRTKYVTIDSNISWQAGLRNVLLARKCCSSFLSFCCSIKFVEFNKHYFLENFVRFI